MAGYGLSDAFTRGFSAVTNHQRALNDERRLEDDYRLRKAEYDDRAAMRDRDVQVRDLQIETARTGLRKIQRDDDFEVGEQRFMQQHSQSLDPNMPQEERMLSTIDAAAKFAMESGRRDRAQNHWAEADKIRLALMGREVAAADQGFAASSGTDIGGYVDVFNRRIAPLLSKGGVERKIVSADYDPEGGHFNIVTQSGDRQQVKQVRAGREIETFIQDLRNPEFAQKLLATARQNEVTRPKSFVMAPNTKLVNDRGQTIAENPSDQVATVALKGAEGEGERLFVVDKRTGASQEVPTGGGQNDGAPRARDVKMDQAIMDVAKNFGEEFVKVNPLGGPPQLTPKGEQLATWATGLQQHYRPDGQKRMTQIEAAGLAARLTREGATSKMAWYEGDNGQRVAFRVLIDKNGNRFPVGPLAQHGGRVPQQGGGAAPADGAAPAQGGAAPAGAPAPAPTTVPSPQSSGPRPVAKPPSAAEILGMSAEEAAAITKPNVMGPIPDDPVARDRYVQEAKARIQRVREQQTPGLTKVRELESQMDPNYTSPPPALPPEEAPSNAPLSRPGRVAPAGDPVLDGVAAARDRAAARPPERPREPVLQSVVEFEADKRAMNPRALMQKWLSRSGELHPEQAAMIGGVRAADGLRRIASPSNQSPAGVRP